MSERDKAWAEECRVLAELWESEAKYGHMEPHARKECRRTAFLLKKFSKILED